MKLRAALVLSLAASSVGCGSSSAPVNGSPLAGAACETTSGLDQLRRDGRYMVDGANRIVLLHGMNAVWKLKPYFPPDSAHGFTAADADWLREHGFNSVRLGVIFAGVMPQPGVVDTQYLANVDRVVQLLASRGIYVMFDFHQDLYNEKYLGEGFPDWAVYDDGMPATNQAGFPGNYFTPTVSHVFDNLWMNHAGLWEHYAAAWAAVATKWSVQDHHGGYDLFNEPYPGSQFASCANTQGCPLFDTQFLQPMQERAMAGVRTADAGNIVWFEPNFVFNGGAQTSLGLVKTIADPNIGLSWHKYCLLGVVLHSQGFNDLPGCTQMHQVVSDNAEAAIKRMKSTTLVTEFGASDDLADIQQVMTQTDAQFTGWQYWAYKEWGDPTTESQTSGGQGMFRHDTDFSSVKADKLALLERPYPQATAGVPLALSFDAASKTFSYSYTPRCAGGPTEIYVPKLHYPDGYRVTVTGARVTSAPGAALLKLDADKDATEVSVKVTPTA